MDEIFGCVSLVIYVFCIIPWLWKELDFISFVIVGIFIGPVVYMLIVGFVYGIIMKQIKGVRKVKEAIEEMIEKEQAEEEALEKEPFYLLEGLIYMQGCLVEASGCYSDAKKKIVARNIKRTVSTRTEKELYYIFNFGRRNSDRYVEAAISLTELHIDGVSTLKDLADLVFLDGQPQEDALILLNKAAVIWCVPDSQKSWKHHTSEQTELQDDELKKSYKILGASPSDSIDIISRKRRELIFRYHPDKVSGAKLGQDFIELAEEKIKEINNAYDCIARSRNKR